MSWWSIENINTGQIWKEGETPLILVDCIKGVDIVNGHTLHHKDVVVKCRNLELDFRTGTTWINKSPHYIVETIDKPERLVLFKRKSIDGTIGEVQEEFIYIGIISKYNKGIIFKTRTDTILDEWHMVPYIHGEQIDG